MNSLVHMCIITDKDPDVNKKTAIRVKIKFQAGLLKERYNDIIYNMDNSGIFITFTKRVELILKNIPYGKVTSYGAIAALAGSPRAARQVVQILHRTDNIPWHRVVNSQGKIAIKEYDGFQEQKILLSMEGVESDSNGKIDLNKYQWKCYSNEELI